MSAWLLALELAPQLWSYTPTTATPPHTHTGRLSAGVAELARNLEGGRSEELLSIFAVHVLSFTRFDKF